ncbi:hypothetical protein 2 [Wenling tombus-like virus 2]|uniref:hypothetical protein 2 n=1 Tax=Wenling tombus-like virus 2 TaxID=1923544 RepID=UPI00090A4FCD|nr:hypothetical protein 2 [Wenling tombus-like virus 2]APG76587.1 hypothetical protein 2 [Wenling tombus-like virus 2]
MVQRVDQISPLPTYDYQLDVQKWSMHQVVKKYEGPQRAKMVRALYYTRQLTITRWHSRVKMFIKQEKVLDPQKPPRAIQYRTAEYNLMLGQYLKPIEKALYMYRDSHGLPVFAKGYNVNERAWIVKDKYELFDDPVIYQVDFSKFDAHVTKQHLEAEHAVYLKAFPGSHTLSYLLKQQLANNGITQNGIKYHTNGKRMSGDLNTGLGNSIIHHLLAMQVAPKFVYFIDGDDGLWVGPRSAHIDLMLVRRFGFDLKIDKQDSLSGTSFCSTRLMLSTMKFVRPPWVILSKHAMTYRNLPPNKNAQLLRAIGECELACNSGIPVIQEFAKRLMTLSDKPLYDPELAWKRQNLESKEALITDEARIEYASIFDMSIAEQVCLESAFQTPSSEVQIHYGDSSKRAPSTSPGDSSSCPQRPESCETGIQLDESSAPTATEPTWDWQAF